MTDGPVGVSARVWVKTRTVVPSGSVETLQSRTPTGQQEETYSSALMPPPHIGQSRWSHLDLAGRFTGGRGQRAGEPDTVVLGVLVGLGPLTAEVRDGGVGEDGAHGYLQMLARLGERLVVAPPVVNLAGLPLALGRLGLGRRALGRRLNPLPLALVAVWTFTVPEAAASRRRRLSRRTPGPPRRHRHPAAPTSPVRCPAGAAGSAWWCRALGTLLMSFLFSSSFAWFEPGRGPGRPRRPLGAPPHLVDSPAGRTRHTGLCTVRQHSGWCAAAATRRKRHQRRGPTGPRRCWCVDCRAWLPERLEVGRHVDELLHRQGRVGRQRAALLVIGTTGRGIEADHDPVHEPLDAVQGPRAGGCVGHHL